MVPGGALGRGADAMAEILVEVRRPSVPMNGDRCLRASVCAEIIGYALSKPGGRGQRFPIV